jgi:predicted esterase
VIARTIDTTTHGRYVVVPAASGPAPLLVGFHGYAELADAHLERLRVIPGADRWTIVSIQGLNRFYQRRTNEVIAGWMTRQDRELAIADNIAYVGRVVDAVSREWRVSDAIVFAGFSQGVAMAFRAAAARAGGERRPAVTGVIAAGGDVPPEIERDALRRLDAVLVCRGSRDQWYTPETYQADLQRLREAGVPVRPLEFDGGHEWSPEVIQAAAQLLDDCRR